MLGAATYKRLVQEAPEAVMVRTVLEHALEAEAVDEVFENCREDQYTRTLLVLVDRPVDGAGRVPRAAERQRGLQAVSRPAGRLAEVGLQQAQRQRPAACAPGSLRMRPSGCGK